MFNIFKRKTKGCLHGKTEQQKITFFQSLSSFAIKDEQFFVEQYWDLQPHERDEYAKWVLADKQQKKAMLQTINAIKTLLELKHKK
jgi:hypothetical protein